MGILLKENAATDPRAEVLGVLGRVVLKDKEEIAFVAKVTSGPCEFIG